MTFLLALILASIAILACALLVERRLRTSAASRHTMLVAALFAPVVFWSAVALATALPKPRSGALVTKAVAGATALQTGTNVPYVLWVAGFVLVLARSAHSALRWRGVAQRAIERNGFFVSHECDAPMVIGIVTPKIVLPNHLDGLTPAELETIFAHERAHIARRDNLVAALVQLVCAAFWFDPLHRVARRRLLVLREQACDEAVLARGCDPQSYLTALARSCDPSFRSSAVACMSRIDLRERMESIMTTGTPRRLPFWAVAMAIGVAAIAFAAIAPAPNIFAGGGETKKPKILTRVDAVYTEDAKKAGTTGNVVLDINIDAHGVVEKVKVKESLPHGLDQAAVDAIRQWRFEPATVDGKPVAVSLTITVNFRLD